MTVLLTIELTGSLSDDERKLLMGIGMTIIAVAGGANDEDEGEGEPAEPEPPLDKAVSDLQEVARQMADAGLIHETPELCGQVDPKTGRVCVNTVHRGRHLFRQPVMN